MPPAATTRRRRRTRALAASRHVANAAMNRETHRKLCLAEGGAERRQHGDVRDRLCRSKPAPTQTRRLTSQEDRPKHWTPWGTPEENSENPIATMPCASTVGRRLQATKRASNDGGHAMDRQARQHEAMVDAGGCPLLSRRSRWPSGQGRRLRQDISSPHQDVGHVRNDLPPGNEAALHQRPMPPTCPSARLPTC